MLLLSQRPDTEPLIPGTVKRKLPEENAVYGGEKRPRLGDVHLTVERSYRHAEDREVLSRCSAGASTAHVASVEQELQNILDELSRNPDPSLPELELDKILGDKGDESPSKASPPGPAVRSPMLSAVLTGRGTPSWHQMPRAQCLTRPTTLAPATFPTRPEYFPLPVSPHQRPTCSFRSDSRPFPKKEACHLGSTKPLCHYDPAPSPYSQATTMRSSQVLQRLQNAQGSLPGSARIFCGTGDHHHVGLPRLQDPAHVSSPAQSSNSSLLKSQLMRKQFLQQTHPPECEKPRHSGQINAGQMLDCQQRTPYTGVTCSLPSGCSYPMSPPNTLHSSHNTNPSLKTDLCQPPQDFGRDMIRNGFQGAPVSNSLRAPPPQQRSAYPWQASTGCDGHVNPTQNRQSFTRRAAPVSLAQFSQQGAVPCPSLPSRHARHPPAIGTIIKPHPPHGMAPPTYAPHLNKPNHNVGFPSTSPGSKFPFCEYSLPSVGGGGQEDGANVIDFIGTLGDPGEDWLTNLSMIDEYLAQNS